MSAVPPYAGVYAMEQQRTMACLETKTSTPHFVVEPSEATTGWVRRRHGGQAMPDTHVGPRMSLYMRVRVVRDPIMLDLQTACDAAERS